MEKENLIHFFLNEKESLGEVIIPLIETKDFLLKNEPDVFHEEIMTQFRQRLNTIVIEEFCKKFTISPEEAIILLEGISLEEYFKC